MLTQWKKPCLERKGIERYSNTNTSACEKRCSTKWLPHGYYISDIPASVESGTSIVVSKLMRLTLLSRNISATVTTTKPMRPSGYDMFFLMTDSFTR
jgi:hypothetical protein